MSDFKKCVYCNKRTYIPVGNIWAYKIIYYSKYTYFCSWKCLQEYRKDDYVRLRRRVQRNKNHKQERRAIVKK